MTLEEAVSLITKEVILAKRVGHLTSATQLDSETAARIVTAGNYTGYVATSVTRAALGILAPLGCGPH